MIAADAQPATPKPKLRWYQFRLRTIFVLTTVTAVFFSVACSLGYVDAVVALAAFAVLVGILRYPRRVHLATGILLTLIAVIYLWANLRPTGWRREWNTGPPVQLYPITKAMFWRGWPVCPFMFAEYRHMTFISGGEGALVFDGLFYALILFAVKAACERCFRHRSWLLWVAYGILIPGMLMLTQGVVAFYLRFNFLTGTHYGPSLIPVYIIFTGVGVLVIGFAFKMIADHRNQKEQKTAK